MNKQRKRNSVVVLSTVIVATALLNANNADAQQIAKDRSQTVTTVSSTIPSNGDINPYGVFRVARTVGRLNRGSILVSNFNNSANLQGTGTTLVQISPEGNFSLFALINPATLPGPCPGGVGLTTALVVLRSGWVIVGSLPTTDGMADTAQAGCLIVLASNGDVIETLTAPPINGPWDMNVFDSSGEKSDRPGEDSSGEKSDRAGE